MAQLASRFEVHPTRISAWKQQALDWAVYLDRDGAKKLYFVLETKGDAYLFSLRTPERLKIHCGKQQCKALDSDVEPGVARDWKEFRTSVRHQRGKKAGVITKSPYQAR